MRMFTGTKFKMLKGVAAALVLSVITVTVALAAVNLPTDPVTVTHGPWNGNAPDSTLEITLSDVPAGFDVMNGPYDGWCIEDNHQSNSPPVSGTLVEPSGLLWEQINWVLNNWPAYGDYNNAQIAIWRLTGTTTKTGAEALYQAALANGAGFVPGPGQVAAVVAFSDNFAAGQYQDTIIEVPIPDEPPGGEGCTPGYWRNHFEDWPATGFSPDDDFDTVFGVDYFSPDITLGEAIWLGGGGVKKVARHGTAGLLSAAHPDVAYPYTVAEVIAFVQAGDVEDIVAANELGCSIP